MTIKSLGVELEGAWQKLPEAFFNSENKYHMKVYRNDGSLHNLEELLCKTCNKNTRYCICEVKNFDNADMENNNFKYVGECASYPYFHINNMLKFIEDYYPIKTNKTCGLHIHLKPENLNEYQKLMSKKFYNDFIQAVKYWAKSRQINEDSELYRRLKGTMTYCKLGFVPHQNGTDSPHYNMISYCYAKHGTIEIRVFPAFQSMYLARDAVRFTYDFTNSWLICNNNLKSKRSHIPVKNIVLGDL